MMTTHSHRLALLVATALTLAQAASAAVQTAYLWADQPTRASYSPSATYRSESAGEATITRSGPGRYTVNLGTFLPAPDSATGPAGALGNVQVTAYGPTSNFCQLISWTPAVSVACFDSTGRPTDTRFSLLATVGIAGTDVAYAWANQPRSASYSASSAYALGTAGARVAITRRGIGDYRVGLGSAAGIGSNVQVSAYGPAATPRRCKITRWSLGTLWVTCRDATGALADSAFSALAVHPDAESRDFNFVWSNNAAASSSVPARAYWFAPDLGGDVRVLRNSAGLYRVTLGTRLANVIVTAYGTDGAYCHPVSWGERTVAVACQDARGIAADARFTLLGSNPSDALPTPPPPPPGPPLFGYVDMHTHPASFLGFGGRADGRQGMMWGSPAVGASRGESAASRFGACYANDHSEMGSEITDPDNWTKQYLREQIIGVANARTHYPHTESGAPSFAEWPNSLVVTHQQIDVEWLRRAQQGGLRVVVAAAVDNELIDTAYDWNFTRLMPLLRDFFAGRPLRAALGLPRAGFAVESAREQLQFMRQMVGENCDFMEIALSGADARRIVAAGKLAVVLGTEFDTLTPTEITRLIDEEGVRFVTPIHFVDNTIGGSAAYERMFSLLSGLVGASGMPQSMENNAASDFLLTQPFGAAQADIDFLTGSALGWPPIGERCAADARTASGRLGCSGQINSQGLTTAGRTWIRDLLRRGVMVDMAHMSEKSQADTLAIAETLHRPVFDSHTGMRTDDFAEGAAERAIPARFARRLLNLGGVIGVGTGVGELDDPRRIYYNAGNPLIDFREGRNTWSLDLRGPEFQQAPPTGMFSRYRVTLRIGGDNVEPVNSVAATLLARSGALGDCAVVPEGRGAANHSLVVSVCTLPTPHSIAEIDGLKLAHTARNCDVCHPDNVSIDEVVLEVDTGSATTGWLTVLQRTGGNEGEVVRLKAPGPERDVAFASHYWVTRMLPRASDFEGTVTGLQVRTFTNEDDLGGSAPARIKLSLSGHRESTLQELVFATGGAPAGTFTNEPLRFLSGGEQLLMRDDRAPSLSFGGLTLAVGASDRDEMLHTVAKLRAAANAGTFERSDVQTAIGVAAAGAAVGVSVVAGWAIADPISATIAGLITAGILEAHDNWSSLVAIDATVRDASGRDRSVPFLVGYNPMQRIKGAQADSQLFRGLPERIEAKRLYAGLVANFSLTTQEDRSDVAGDELSFEIVFSDGGVIRRSHPASHRIGIGAEQRLFIPFDRLRAGAEIAKVVLRSSTGHVLVRALDLGLMKDPSSSFAEAFAQFDGLGKYPNQIGIGSDLSGFEALVPFSVFDPGFDPLRIPDTCRGTIVGGVCISVPTPIPTERLIDRLPPYRLDVERIAGRADPARAIAARRVPGALDMGRVDGSSGRVLDFRQSGLSTVGQLPELVATAAWADRQARGSSATLGPRMFNSADGFVRAWEVLDFGVARPPARPGSILTCR